jgi:hypothetical protein
MAYLLVLYAYCFFACFLFRVEFLLLYVFFFCDRRRRFETELNNECEASVASNLLEHGLAGLTWLAAAPVWWCVWRERTTKQPNKHTHKQTNKQTTTQTNTQTNNVVLTT